MKKLTMSYDQGLGEIFEKGRTFGQVIAKAAEEVPDKAYIRYEDTTITFSQLHEKTNMIAYNLLKHGFRKGDKIGLCLPDWPAYTLVYYACAKIGVITSPISPRYREKEFSMILGHSEAKSVLIASEGVDFNYIDMVERLQKEGSIKLDNIVVVGDETSSLIETISYESLTSSDKDKQEIEKYLEEHLMEHPVDADDLLEIAYTSGTTGVPKGVMQTHNNRIAAGTLNNEAWGSLESDVMIMMAPLCHSTGSNHAQNGALVGRFTVVYMGQWEITKTLMNIERFGGTIMIGVPAMFIRIMNHPDFKKYDISSVRGLWCAGSPVALSVAKEITEAFQANFIQTYGTTECGGNHCTKFDDPLELACGTGGPTVRGMEAKIVDEKGRIVPIGQPGEICSRGITRFLGYYKNPEITAEFIDEVGWFHSGDLGVMDENGYIKIIGRIKDMVIRGGENIYTSEMEEAIHKHPQVLEAYVVGYPDDDLGERTCAFIVPREKGCILTRDDFVKFLDGKIAKYKIPDRVEMLDNTPLTHSGKVQKFKLQELLTNEMGLEGAKK